MFGFVMLKGRSTFTTSRSNEQLSKKKKSRRFNYEVAYVNFAAAIRSKVVSSTYGVGQGQGEEVEPVVVPLRDDLRERLEVAALLRPFGHRVLRVVLVQHLLLLWLMLLLWVRKVLLPLQLLLHERRRLLMLHVRSLHLRRA